MNEKFLKLMEREAAKDVEHESFAERFSDTLALDKGEAVKEAYKRGYYCGADAVAMAIDEDLSSFVELSAEEKKLITKYRTLTIAEKAIFNRVVLYSVIS